MARVPHGVRLHTRVPQMKHGRQRRLPVPLTRACNGTWPQWVDESQPRWGWRYILHTGLRAKHSLLADSGCRLGWASAPHRECCLELAPSHLRRLLRFSHTRATYEDWQPFCSFGETTPFVRWQGGNTEYLVAGLLIILVLGDYSLWTSEDAGEKQLYYSQSRDGI